MDSESAKLYFAPTQYQTLYLQIVSKLMLTGKRSNQLRHGDCFSVCDIFRLTVTLLVTGCLYKCVNVP